MVGFYRGLRIMKLGYLATFADFTRGANADTPVEADGYYLGGRHSADALAETDGGPGPLTAVVVAAAWVHIP